MTAVASWRVRALLAAIEAGRDDVIITSSPSRSLKLVPKMMFASGSAARGSPRRLGDLEQAEVRRAGDVEQDPLGAGDVDLEERARDRHAGGLDGAVLAGRPADPHERRAGVLHDRPHVGEVEVDQSRHRDDVADPLHALAEHVVDDAEGVDDRRVLLDDVLQTVVRDRDQGVDLGLQLLGRLLGDELALRTSNANGLVTTPIVRAPASFASCATIGAAPEPVPPPSPAVMKTMSESASAWAIFSESSSAARAPIVLSPPAPRPRVILSPIRILWGASDWRRAWASVLQEMNSTPSSRPGSSG
jgi:hypothetical protein